MLVLEGLPDTISGFTIHKLVLPVEFVRARALVIAEYDKLVPSAVIMLGEGEAEARLRLRPGRKT